MISVNLGQVTGNPAACSPDFSYQSKPMVWRLYRICDRFLSPFPSSRPHSWESNNKSATQEITHLL